MDIVEFGTFEAGAEAFDADVCLTPEIDRFCSSALWVLPARAAFHAQSPPLVLRSSAGTALLAAGKAASLGRYLAAGEAMWGLACPLIAPTPEVLAAHFAQAMRLLAPTWDVLWIGGVLRGGRMFRSLVPALSGFAELRLGPVTKRWTATLDGGFDGWFARRSPKFRTNARRDLRKAQEAGVVITPLDAPPGMPSDPAALYARIQDIEARSWKGELGSGFVAGDMRAFYAKMLPRLIARGALRALVAQKDGVDIAFIFGGVLGGTYRGLQVSFDNRYRELALGNVMQLEMIRRLADEGLHTYDLGSDMDYKARWSEPGLETTTVIAFRR